jgi:hypothetical protein
MDSANLVSLVASIASLILAVVAIALSIVFYRMSSQMSESTKEASKNIGASVDRLEKLFDKLYSDTFSMMKDTVSDMRKLIWPAESEEESTVTTEAGKKEDDKFKSLEKELQKQLGVVLERQLKADENIMAVKTDVVKLMEKAVRQSREIEVESRSDSLRSAIILALRNSPHLSGVRASNILDMFGKSYNLKIIVNEIKKMHSEHLVEYEPLGALGPDTMVRLI